MSADDLGTATETFATAAQDNAREGVLLLAARDVVTSIQVHHNDAPYLSKLLGVAAALLEVAAIYTATDNRLIAAGTPTDARRTIEAELWSAVMGAGHSPTRTVQEVLRILVTADDELALPDSTVLDELERATDAYRPHQQ
jgi:hypothetical protein